MSITAVDSSAVFRVEHVSKIYELPRESLLRARKRNIAVADVTFSTRGREILGVVGESGSGKSTLARLLVRLEEPDAGEIYLDDRPIAHVRGHELRRFRRDVQIVFQDPMSSLDPRMRVGKALAEPLRALDVDGSHSDRIARVLEAVQLPRASEAKYPHEFSGGQRQRIAIARALVPEPRVLVADEPVSALDVSVQAQILNLLADLRSDFGLTVVLIAHDLSVVRHMTDRVLVMYGGRVVEAGPTREIFDDPRHPYTQELIDSIPTLEGGLPRRRQRREPERPDAEGACGFSNRCPLVHERCLVERPALEEVAPASGRRSACHLRDGGQLSVGPPASVRRDAR